MTYVLQSEKERLLPAPCDELLRGVAVYLKSRREICLA